MIHIAFTLVVAFTGCGMYAATCANPEPWFDPNPDGTCPSGAYHEAQVMNGAGWCEPYKALNGGAYHVTVVDGALCSVPIEDDLNTIIGHRQVPISGTGTFVVQYDRKVFVAPDPEQEFSRLCLDSSGNWIVDESSVVECAELEALQGFTPHCQQ